jgi:serine/threonine protein kinase
MRERWQRLESLFAAAVDLPPDERHAFLDQACAGDAALRAELQSLLDAERGAREVAFIRNAVQAASEDLTHERDVAPMGRQLGAYRLIRKLGHGGMGTVFLAVHEQDSRAAQVALKVIRPEHQTAELLRRFERERAILARLANPGIARLLDAGATPDGIMYLVMEYVDGEPIDLQCDALTLGLTRRIALVRRVCAAVQHAHDADVIHRDIKPSNVLVTQAVEPKLVDFGIAKRLHGGVGLAGATTAMASRMTPAYASPEQVRGEPLTVATDIYSLGVVLYRLLARAHPYQLEGQLMSRQIEIISTARPVPPSEAARNSGVTWSGKLDRELDAIVLRALAKEPAARHRSVLELDRQLERWQEVAHG